MPATVSKKRPSCRCEPVGDAHHLERQPNAWSLFDKPQGQEALQGLSGTWWKVIGLAPGNLFKEVQFESTEALHYHTREPPWSVPVQDCFKGIL